jgi:hypothetical protein
MSKKNLDMDFYSARLLFVAFVKNSRAKKSNLYDDSVIVFRARDFDHAFQRALEIGKAKETTYKNPYGQTVRWALVEIVNIDYIGKVVDGSEVASRLHHHIGKEPITLKTCFHPEQSNPSGSF